MRYERSSPVPTGPPRRSRPSPWRRPLPLGLAALVLVGGGVAAGVASSGSGPGIERGPAARAVARVFLQANVLEQNLGAPPPQGAGGPSWVLQAVPVVRGPKGARLAVAEHPWVGPDGNVDPLSRAEAAALRADQSRAIDTVFSGDARRRELAILDRLVAGEAGSTTNVVAPGGAKVGQWYSLHVSGSTARVEALVVQWEQRDTVLGPPGARRIASSIVTDEVDALATLVRTPGGWKVSSLAVSPWQQPT